MVAGICLLEIDAKYLKVHVNMSLILTGNFVESQED